MEIRGPGGIGGPKGIDPDRKPARAQARGGEGRSGSDRVEISEESRIKGIVLSAPAIRSDLVARIREEIKSGRYLTDKKLDDAFDNMLKEESGA